MIIRTCMAVSTDCGRFLWVALHKSKADPQVQASNSSHGCFCNLGAVSSIRHCLYYKSLAIWDSYWGP